MPSAGQRKRAKKQARAAVARPATADDWTSWIERADATEARRDRRQSRLVKSFTDSGVEPARVDEARAGRRPEPVDPHRPWLGDPGCGPPRLRFWLSVVGPEGGRWPDWSSPWHYPSRVPVVPDWPTRRRA